MLTKEALVNISIVKVPEVVEEIRDQLMSLESEGLASQGSDRILETIKEVFETLASNYNTRCKRRAHYS